MPSYSEVLDFQAERAKASASAPSPHALMALLRESQRGAVVLEELVDSAAWDLFRSNLAGRMKPAEAERDRLREHGETGALVGDERARADLRLQYLRGFLAAMQIALDLPKELIGTHKHLETAVLGDESARGGLERPQHGAHNPDQAGSTPARATKRPRARLRKGRR